MYQLTTPDASFKLTCRIPGEFNVYNSMATATVGLELGLTPEQITSGIAALEGVEGRMATVDAGQAFSVIVDFAHTPDALKQFLSAMTGLSAGAGKAAEPEGKTGEKPAGKPTEARKPEQQPLPVGDSGGAPKTSPAVRSLLTRNGIPHAFRAVGTPAADAVLRAVGVESLEAAARGKQTRSEELGHQEFILTYKTFEPIGPACLPAA